MAGARAALGPVMILGECAGWSGLTLAALVVTGLLSDIFDAVVARRWKCDTAEVRRFDSMADIVFYFGCAVALWMRHPSVVRNLAVPTAVVIALEALCLGVSLLKFGKLPSYHSYLAKAWGLALASALVAAFVTEHPAGWLAAALALGALSNLEGLTISLILPEWRHDVKTVWRARALRRQILLGAQADNMASRPLTRTNYATPLVRRSLNPLTLVMLAVSALTAYGSSIPSVTFIGGSAPGISAGTPGALDTGTEQLAFHWHEGDLAIPYAQIQNFGYREQRAFHLGVLPTIVIRLLRPAMYRHILTVSYLDGSGEKQVAVFEVPKEAKDTLPAVLQERAGICADQSQIPCRGASPTQSLRTRLLHHD